MSAWRSLPPVRGRPSSVTDLTRQLSRDWLRTTTLNVAGANGAPTFSVADRTSGEPITYSPVVGSSG